MFWLFSHCYSHSNYRDTTRNDLFNLQKYCKHSFYYTRNLFHFQREKPLENMHIHVSEYEREICHWRGKVVLYEMSSFKVDNIAVSLIPLMIQNLLNGTEYIFPTKYVNLNQQRNSCFTADPNLKNINYRSLYTENFNSKIRQKL